MYCVTVWRRMKKFEWIEELGRLIPFCLHLVEMHQVVAFYLGYDKMELSALGHLAHHFALGISAYLFLGFAPLLLGIGVGGGLVNHILSFALNLRIVGYALRQQLVCLHDFDSI